MAESGGAAGVTCVGARYSMPPVMSLCSRASRQPAGIRSKTLYFRLDVKNFPPLRDGSNLKTRLPTVTILAIITPLQALHKSSMEVQGVLLPNLKFIQVVYIVVAAHRLIIFFSLK